MNISQVVKVLGKRSLEVAWENDASTIDEDVKLAKLLEDSIPAVDQVLVICKLSLNGKGLRRVLFCDSVELNNITANECNSRTIIKIPMSKTTTDARASARYEHNFMKEIAILGNFFVRVLGLASLLGASNHGLVEWLI